jgi:O-methyltransferase
MKISQGINYLFGRLLNHSKIYLTNSLNYLSRKRNVDRNYMDHIRLSTLELVAHEIDRNNILGSVAELGVYKGKFARYINLYFPGRKLYLFDTFRGFDEKDIRSEHDHTYSSGSQDFSNTSAQKVLKKMPHPGQCIIRQGHFPETATGLEDEFAFVNIDADLFDPIYNGLSYFYPRLSKGGYIFVHDYSNDGYKGAREAVEKFCQENNINKLPLPDACGTVVLMK